MDFFSNDGRRLLLVIGRTPSATVVIGVEGKSDEPFDWGRSVPGSPVLGCSKATVAGCPLRRPCTSPSS
jgi:hypothetical protein